MCEPGSPAKRYGGVHTTGGEYKTILSSVWLSPASVQPAGRRRSLLPTLLTRRPQSAAPAPAPAAVLPRPPSRGRRRRRRPGRARACAPTDPVTAAEASSLGRHTHSQNPKGVPKARRGDYGHANIKPAIGGYYYGDYIATHNAPRLALQCLVSRRARGSQPQALDRHGHDATGSNSFTCIGADGGPQKERLACNRKVEHIWIPVHQTSSCHMRVVERASKYTHVTAALRDGPLYLSQTTNHNTLDTLESTLCSLSPLERWSLDSYKSMCRSGPAF